MRGLMDRFKSCPIIFSYASESDSILIWYMHHSDFGDGVLRGCCARQGFTCKELGLVSRNADMLGHSTLHDDVRFWQWCCLM